MGASEKCWLSESLEQASSQHVFVRRRGTDRPAEVRQQAAKSDIREACNRMRMTAREKPMAPRDYRSKGRSVQA